MASFSKHLKKDLRLFLALPESLYLQFSLSLLLSVVAALGVQSAILPVATEERIYPVLLWLVFILTGSIALGKSLDAELEGSAIQRLVLQKESFSKIYLSKVISNFLVLFLGFLLNSILLAVLINLDIFNVFLWLCVLALLVALAYASLITLLVAMAAQSKLGGLLLPLLLLPLMFPLFFAGLELSFELILNQEFLFDSFAMALLLFLNVLYLMLGINLYEHCFKS